MQDHRRIAAIVLAAVVVAGAIGWIAGSRIKSPAEIAARTDAPPAAPILVPAEERVLSTDIVTRGTARFGSPQQLVSVPSALKGNAGVPAQLPQVGTELREGDIVYTTSGRPVFLLSGVQPTFRDLGPGIEGQDVRQLEEGLARLGFDPGPIDGVYDGGTENAVEAWYVRSGHRPFTASAEQLAAVRLRESEQNTATIDVLGARESVALAEVMLQGARDAHARAVAAAAAAPAELEVQRALAAANNQSAAAEIAWKQAAYDAAVDAEAPAAEIAAAQAEVDFARASAEVTRLNGERDVAVAQAAVSSTKADVQSALGEIRSAETLLDIAKGALHVRERQAELAASDLDLARLQAGVQVPADELIFIAVTPVRVSEVLARNDAGVGPTINVTNALVAIDGSLRLEEASLAKPGMQVLIDEPDLGIEATGVINRVAETPGTNGADGFHVYFEVVVENPPPSLVGASVRMTVPVESTGGNVLVVPVSAVTLSADGSSRVQVDRDGKLEYITVEPALSAQGFVAVTPVDGELGAGDLVVIGYGQQDKASSR